MWGRRVAHPGTLLYSKGSDTERYRALCPLNTVYRVLYDASPCTHVYTHYVIS